MSETTFLLRAIATNERLTLDFLIETFDEESDWLKPVREELTQLETERDVLSLVDGLRHHLSEEFQRNRRALLRRADGPKQQALLVFVRNQRQILETLETERDVLSFACSHNDESLRRCLDNIKRQPHKRRAA